MKVPRFMNRAVFFGEQSEQACNWPGPLRRGDLAPLNLARAKDEPEQTPAPVISESQRRINEAVRVGFIQAREDDKRKQQVAEAQQRIMDQFTGVYRHAS
ncbi:hypothetical protein [Thiocapsa bogorovii]|uniref:hypothetical protein n=1 Tax=Thiocapsa bogorovii TaxID=521689 RepID=UPI001E64BEC3|nr:hypothetical protein [Thiocapsa bogorovii]UHD15723.1 hypothetical protein LT988_21080 [Thiocapsa bogorovii]